MSKCPYPEKIVDYASGEVVSNSQSRYWHEGYEAHKLEVMKLMEATEALAAELAKSAREIEGIREELNKSTRIQMPNIRA